MSELWYLRLTIDELKQHSFRHQSHFALLRLYNQSPTRYLFEYYVRQRRKRNPDFECLLAE